MLTLSVSFLFLTIVAALFGYLREPIGFVAALVFFVAFLFALAAQLRRDRPPS